MRALPCATVAAATPRACRITSAAMPAPSLPTPASLKHTNRSGCCSANSAELVPPCEPQTTIAPRSPAASWVIEAITITRPRGPRATCSLRIARLWRAMRGGSQGLQVLGEVPHLLRAQPERSLGVVDADHV